MSAWNGFRAVLRKELAGRWPLLLAALLLGGLPFALPLLPQARGQAPADLREAAALVIAGLGTLLLAVVLGTDLLSRELVERRLSFYLSRPLRIGTLLLGKLAAAHLVLLAGTLLLVAPVALVDGINWILPGLGTLPLGVAIACSLAAMLAAPLLALLLLSALAVMVRTRSSWLALDLTGLALAALVAGVAAERLWNEGARAALAVGVVALAVAAVTALWSAHYRALANGRTDAAAARRALSARLWALLLPAAIGFAGFAVWVLSPTPNDLAGVWSAQPAPQGPWLAVAGPLRHRFGFDAVFLWNSETGRSVRLRLANIDDSLTEVSFSANGRTAAWAERDGDNWAIWELDLSANSAPRRTTVSYPSRPSALSVSPAGRYLLVRNSERWLLEDPVSGRLLASAPEDAFTEGVRWLDEERVRIFDLSGFDQPQATVRIWDLGTPQVGAVASDERRTSGFLHTLAGAASLKPSPDGRRVLLHESSGWSLFDVETQARLAVAAPEQPRATFVPDARLPAFLADGRILMSRREGDRLTVLLTDADGKTQRAFDIGRGRRLLLGGQFDAETLIALWVGPTGEDASALDHSHGLLRIDLAKGAVQQLGRGLWPAQVLYSSSPTPTGSAASWLLSTDGRLVHLAADNTLTTRLGPGAGDRLDSHQ